MTFFAFNECVAGLDAQIVNEIIELKKTHKHETVNVFAIIDCAFDESFFTQLPWREAPHVSLYDTNQLREFGSAAPFIVSLPTAESRLSGWIETLLTACGARPMWSLVTSTLKMDDLVLHFAPFLIGQCEDKLEWPIRWGDSRVFPALMTLLPSASRQDLLHPIYSWITCSRKGEILTFRGRGMAEVPSLTYPKLPLDDDTFAKLVDAAEADSVIAQIAESEPEFLQSRSPYESYSLVQSRLKVADELGVTQPGPRKHFASMALYLPDGFFFAAEYQKFLDSLIGGTNYFSAVANLIDEIQ